LIATPQMFPENADKIAENVIIRTIAELPAPIREEAVKVGFLIHEEPFEDLEPETLGFYPVMESDCVAEQPGPIFLFLRPIARYAFESGEQFADEVVRTYLHELGHHLGWDEDDLAVRGLD